MPRPKHRELKRMARNMLTAEERENHVPIFTSAAWEARSNTIDDRVRQQQARAHQRAKLRKAALKEAVPA